MSTPENFETGMIILGVVLYYRKYIKNFAMIAKPLYQLFKKDAHFC